MTARLDSVAKFICEQSGWRVSNLSLQKLVYLAQVESMARLEMHLIDEAFEAWDYGPVIPDLYRKAKIFGSSPIRDIFYDARRFRENDPRRTLMQSICRKYIGKKPGELVEISHWDFGAWAKKYEPKVRGIAITDDDIQYEIRSRRKYADLWARINGGVTTAYA